MAAGKAARARVSEFRQIGRRAGSAGADPAPHSRQKTYSGDVVSGAELHPLQLPFSL